MGPTAGGKSALAARLAKRFPVEIVSVDSAQIYRGMDIGTAKPSHPEQAAVPYHLLDILDPTESYSAARFCSDAMPLVREIAGRGRTPLLVGGTMLYFKALREGLSKLPESDSGMRARIDAEAAERGWPALHADLAAVDPATAARVKPTDSQRIQRALEVYRITGKSMSHLQGHRVKGGAGPRHVAIALVPADREELHRRIETRFDAMLRNGLVDELQSLRQRYALTPSLPSMRCVGYRQAWQYLEGHYGWKDLRTRGVQATRQLAKRQLTWIRSMDGVDRFDGLASDLDERVWKRLRQEGFGDG
jgi:tRNA dimethylallyltransferase